MTKRESLFMRWRRGASLWQHGWTMRSFEKPDVEYIIILALWHSQNLIRRMLSGVDVASTVFRDQMHRTYACTPA